MMLRWRIEKALHCHGEDNGVKNTAYACTRRDHLVLKGASNEWPQSVHYRAARLSVYCMRMTSRWRWQSTATAIVVDVMRNNRVAVAVWWRETWLETDTIGCWWRFALCRARQASAWCTRHKTLGHVCLDFKARMGYRLLMLLHWRWLPAVCAVTNDNKRFVYIYILNFIHQSW